MKAISTEYTLSYAIQTYEDMKKTYDLIMRVIQVLPINIITSEKFSYHIGKNVYTTDNIEEFTEYGYGMPQFVPDQLLICIYQDKSSLMASDNYIGSLCYMNFDKDEDFSILHVDAISNQWLEKIINALHEISCKKSIKEEHTIYIENQYNTASAVINGGQENVISHNNINNGTGNNISKNEPRESKVSPWMQGVFQSLSANLIWQVILFLFAALIAYLRLKK